MTDDKYIVQQTALHGIAYGQESKERRRQPQGEVFSKIKCSAVLSLGRIEHWNSSRCLETLTFSYEMQLLSRTWTYATGRRSVEVSHYRPGLLLSPH